MYFCPTEVCLATNWNVMYHKPLAIPTRLDDNGVVVPSQQSSSEGRLILIRGLALADLNPSGAMKQGHRICPSIKKVIQQLKPHHFLHTAKVGRSK